MKCMNLSKTQVGGSLISRFSSISLQAKMPSRCGIDVYNDETSAVPKMSLVNSMSDKFITFAYLKKLRNETG